MECLLFTMNASRAHSALAVRILRDALETAGHRAAFYEALPTERRRRVLSRLALSPARLFGFSAYIWNLPELLRFAEDLKTLRPDAVIVFGGPEVSFAPERFADCGYIDHIICGEGEEAIVALADALSQGKVPPRLIAGTPDRGFLTSPIHYRTDEECRPLVYYESSRGCPFSCAFCLSSVSEGVRAKDAERTLADLAAFEAIPGALTVKLVDRTFNFDRERAKTIWRGLLSPRYTKCYHFEVSAALLDEESLSILSQFPAGKIQLEIGLQSTNPQTLAAVARATDSAAVLRAAGRLMAGGGVTVHLDLIAGLPHETPESFAAGFDAAYFACHSLHLGFLKLLCGTALRRDADALGLCYSKAPPYEVLSTPTMSFALLGHLHAVEELLERLRDSGRFESTLALLLPHHITPFAFYSGLADYLESTADAPLQGIAQKRLYVYVAEFVDGALPAVAARVREALREDYRKNEIGRRLPCDL